MTGTTRTALEFFAGIGLVRMGLERAGWRVVYANDIDPKKRQMHEGHWGPDASYDLRNVFEVDPEKVPEAALAWASFPCVDLSLAGNRAGLSGAESGAYWGFHRILTLKAPELRPPIVVLENVSGMLTSHGGADLETIVSGLNDLGYRTDLLQIDAALFVPQSRPRLFVVGVRPPFSIPSGTAAPSPNAVRPRAVQQFIADRPHLDWGLAPVGALPDQAPVLGDVLERFPADADIWWTRAATDHLVGQMSGRHLELVRRHESSPDLMQFTVYRRVRSSGCMAEVRFDGVAGCLRTPRGGSSRQFVIEVGRGAVRARHMTAVEYARLQGAGDFRIAVPETQALFGFGDAVCVPVVEWLVRGTLEPILEHVPEPLAPTVCVRPRLFAEAR